MRMKVISMSPRHYMDLWDAPLYQLREFMQAILAFRASSLFRNYSVPVCWDLRIIYWYDLQKQENMSVGTARIIPNCGFRTDK